MSTSSAAHAPCCANFVNTHAFNILEHYHHAREKHPHFCDRFMSPIYGIEESDGHLRVLRNALGNAIKSGCFTMTDVLNCEVEEMLNAIVHGETENAIEEAYDIIAVLLRVIDVLEGRQQLGRPEEGASNGKSE